MKLGIMNCRPQASVGSLDLNHYIDFVKSSMKKVRIQQVKFLNIMLEISPMNESGKNDMADSVAW